MVLLLSLHRVQLPTMTMTITNNKDLVCVPFQDYYYDLDITEEDCKEYYPNTEITDEHIDQVDLHLQCVQLLFSHMSVCDCNKEVSDYVYSMLDNHKEYFPLTDVSDFPMVTIEEDNNNNYTMVINTSEAPQFS